MQHAKHRIRAIPQHLVAGSLVREIRQLAQERVHSTIWRTIVRNGKQRRDTAPSLEDLRGQHARCDLDGALDVVLRVGVVVRGIS